MMETTGVDVTNVKQIGTELSVFLTQLTAWAAVALPSFIGAMLMLFIGWWFASYVERGIRRIFASQHRIDPTLGGVVAGLARYGILVLVIVAVLGQLGIQTTSILAALGAAGLAIGLAMQGTLSNIAAGMMLLWLRPFRVGDYIDTGTVAGSVRDVGLFACELNTWDGLYVFVPNSELWNKRIINYSRLPTRLVDVKFTVGYKGDLKKGQAALLALANANPKALKHPSAPEVFVDTLGDGYVTLRLRCWAATADNETLRRLFNDEGKAALEAAGLSLPAPTADLQALGNSLKAAAGDKAPA